MRISFLDDPFPALPESVLRAMRDAVERRPERFPVGHRAHAYARRAGELIKRGREARSVAVDAVDDDDCLLRLTAEEERYLQARMTELYLR